MHILGKVFIFLAIALILGGSWLTSMTLSVRHRWLTAVETRKQKIEKQLQDISDTRIRIRNLEEQRQQLVHSWGDVWSAPNSRVQPGGTGAIELGAGSSSGLPHRGAEGGSEPTVYVFGEDGGQSKYLGEFHVADIRPTQAIVRLTRHPFSQETEEWPQGMYHVRNTLPRNWLTLTAQLQAQQVIADAHIVEQRQQLEVLNEMNRTSQAALDQRMAELNGNPNALSTASEDVKIGLVETLQKAEASRDAVLTEVGRLRHAMIQTYDDVVKTLESNVKNAEKLESRYEQPAPTTPPSASRTEQNSSAL